MNRQRIMQWTKECTCNSGKTNFGAIKFLTNSSRIEIVCGKCHGVICWLPISTERFVPRDKHKTKEKSLAIPTRSK